MRQGIEHRNGTCTVVGGAGASEGPGRNLERRKRSHQPEKPNTSSPQSGAANEGSWDTRRQLPLPPPWVHQVSRGGSGAAAVPNGHQSGRARGDGGGERQTRPHWLLCVCRDLMEPAQSKDGCSASSFRRLVF